MDTRFSKSKFYTWRKPVSAGLAIMAVAAIAFTILFSPVKIAVINATLAQKADIALNNGSRNLHLTFIDQEDVESLKGPHIQGPIAGIHQKRV